MGKKMESQKILDKLLLSYGVYYNVKTDDVEPPFAAEAEFHSHDERFFLIRKAVIDEVENNEFVYFAVNPRLTLDSFYDLDEKAWKRGMSKVKPSEHHQSTDVSLILLADTIDAEVFQAIKKSSHTVSYRHGLHGYSNYHLIALEVSSGRMVHNRLGYTLKKNLKNVWQQNL
jgi:hypothetical protein